MLIMIENEKVTYTGDNVNKAAIEENKSSSSHST